MILLALAAASGVAAAALAAHNGSLVASNRAEVDRLLADLRAARGETLAAANGLRALLRVADGKPVHLVRISPPGDEVAVLRDRSTLLDLAWENGIEIPAACDGVVECGSCRVRVSEGAERLPAASPKERRILSMYAADPNVRLACVLPVLGDMAVEVEADQDLFPAVVPALARIEARPAVPSSPSA